MIYLFILELSPLWKISSLDALNLRVLQCPSYLGPKYYKYFLISINISNNQEKNKKITFLLGLH